MSAGYVIAGIQELWRSATAMGKDRRHKRGVVAEIDALDPRERARILFETGLSGVDLALALRAPRASDDLLACGLGSLGADVDAGDFAGRYRQYCPR